MGCDAVPADAPPGVNQTYVDAAHPATYRHSDTATFTDVLALSDWLNALGATDGWQVGAVEWQLTPETRASVEHHGLAARPPLGE